MLEFDPSLFADVADALGISEPAIVEKDYYAVQLLKILNSIELDDYTLIFGGGTCLAKAFQNTYRMSEDVDIKLIPNQGILDLSNSARKRCRKNAGELIIKQLESSAFFNLIDTKKRDSYAYQRIDFRYPKTFKTPTSIRPYLQLELFDVIMQGKAVGKPIQSLYSAKLNESPEIESFQCTPLQTTAAEKTIALLRRCAKQARFPDEHKDTTLIRHLYDLHMIKSFIVDHHEEIKTYFNTILLEEVERYKHKHSQLGKDPINELAFGLESIKSNQEFLKNYETVITPLVYNPQPVAFETALSSLDQIFSLLH